MNVYDFDKTIFDGDSTFRFLKYILRHHPSVVLCAPRVAGNALLFATGLREKQAFKERLFQLVFSGFEDVEGLLRAFWDEHAGGIKKWYFETQRADDVVITASPVDIVRPMCERLGIKTVLGSPVDLKTGRYSGRNCHGEEKVRRFYERFPGGVVDDFYSDSHADDPMAKIARRAFFVRGDKITPWK